MKDFMVYVTVLLVTLLVGKYIETHYSDSGGVFYYILTVSIGVVGWFLVNI